MLNVTEETKSAYLGDSIPKTLTISFPDVNITFTNEDIVSESAELIEAIENDTSLTFKGCISSQFKFQVADIVRDLRGQYVEISEKAGDTESIPLFKGYIDTQDNQNHEDILTTFTAYDVLYSKADIECGEWYDGLTFPMTVKAFRDLFFTFLGIEQETITLPNDALSMQKMVSANSQMKALYIMQCICQANARYGQIGRDGLFHYRKLNPITNGLYPSVNTFPSSETYPARNTADVVVKTTNYRDVQYEPYRTAPITKVIVWDEASVVQGEYGDGNNIFKIEGNMVAYSVDLNACAQNIYNEIKAVTLIPTEFQCVGMPWIECGDSYSCPTRLNIITSYVLNRTLKGIQALNDVFVSDIDQYQRETDTLSNQIIKLSGKTNVLTRTLEETRSEITDLDNNLSSRITQNAEAISSEVTARQSGDTALSSRITQNAEAITLKVTKGTVSSEISQEAGKITISSNRLEINSTNFKLSADGTLEAKNGEFSGKLTSSDGTIGGFTIGSSAIYNGMTSLSSTTAGVYLGTDGIAVGWGSGYGFVVKKDGNLTIKPLGATAAKIGTNLTIDSNGYITITNGLKATSTELSFSSKFKVSNSGYTLEVGDVTINNYGTSNYMKVPTNFEIRDSSTTNYLKIKFGSALEVGYAGALKLGNTSGTMGFFGGTGSTKKTVNKLSASATLANVVTKVNDLLTALKDYGLISSS